MFEANLEQCLSKLLELTPKTAGKVEEILLQYCPIQLPPLPDLPDNQFHREDLIQDKYIPSPDLLTSYNTNMGKTFQIQPKTENSKLKQLYGDTKVERNTFDFSQLKYEPQNPLIKPSVLVQSRQETILKDLKDKKIEATIPQMESSLRMFQLKSLEKKQIKLQNITENKQKNNAESLAEWRKMREKMSKNLSKR